MKRKGNFYKSIANLPNILRSIECASLGKTSRRNVAKVLDNDSEYAKRLLTMLVNKTYKPSPYIQKTIKDGSSGKERVIFKPRFFPDQVIHWALMRQLEPILTRKMYAWSCASIADRGIHYGQKHIEKILAKDRKHTKYCLKLDIRKFYPSVDKEILKQKFRKIIKDPDVLWLIDAIVDSSEQGLPIGNYTSQWFANFYLTDLDNYIKQDLKVKHYVRYMDDMVLFSSNKRELHKIKSKIDEFVAKEHLEIKNNWQLFKVDSRPLDFLGYRFYRGYTTLRRSNFLRFKRRVIKIYKKKIKLDEQYEIESNYLVEKYKDKLDKRQMKQLLSYIERNRSKNISYLDACAVISMIGWVVHSNGYNYIHKYITKYISIADCKEVIRNETRKRQKTT